MNKYIVKTILGAALALPVLTSCELDQFPEGTIPAEKSWETVQDASNFHIGLLASLRSLAGDGTKTVAEVQTDLFNQGTSSTSYYQESDWTWTTNQFNGDGRWSGNYSLINTANYILDNVENVAQESAADSAAVREFMGAAYFARAYGYSNLVTRYCKEYDPATAANELGLPLVTTVDVNAKPARASLQATYNLMLSDLEKAATLLANVHDDITAPTAEAVTALQARVYLYCKQYDNAIAAAEKLFTKYPLTKKGDLWTLWSEDAGTEIIYQPLLTTDERSGGSLGSAYFGFNQSEKLRSASYFPTQGLMDLYEAKDARKEVYFYEDQLCSGQYIGTGYIFSKFPGNPALRKSNETDETTWYNAPKVFRTAEMYLIAAEAALFKATPDEVAAQRYLNTLRVARGASETQKSGALLVQEMKDEWAREMVGEGFRLDCLKRWGDGIKRMAPQKSLVGANVLRNADPTLSTELNVAADDARYYKMVWEIPSNDLQTNKNLVGNWPK